MRTLLDAVEKLQIKTAEKTASDAVGQQNTPQNEQFANQMMLQLLPKLIENPDSFSKLIELADKAKSNCRGKISKFLVKLADFNFIRLFFHVVGL